jgi:hypothetical protein
MKKNAQKKNARTCLMLFSIFMIFANWLGCSDDETGTLASSRSYKGHENDADANFFVNAYPQTVGTRLDDCQTCHAGAVLEGAKGPQFKNSCDYCHLLVHPDDSLAGPIPELYTDTLNAYGLAYAEAGRNQQALTAIANEDSDIDGFNNNDEIGDLKYPGDSESHPGQQTAKILTFSLDDITSMSSHEQFLLCNSHKQEFDNYASYKGVSIQALLAETGIDTGDTGFMGITVIAPDGYMKDFSTDDINATYPDSLFYAGLGSGGLGTECGFVQYPDELPPNLANGQAIPGDQRLMLAYERDGLAMETSNLDPTSGKINGEGPFRIIVPQSDPGAPDRGSKYSPTSCNDGHDYDDSKDHNAGDMVRGVIAIRANPLPDGVEDFDYKYGGWAYVDNANIIVYGFGITDGE